MTDPTDAWPRIAVNVDAISQGYVRAGLAQIGGEVCASIDTGGERYTAPFVNGVARFDLGGENMTDRTELAALIARAKEHVMTREEIRKQKISFVYGQLMDAQPDITKEQIAEEHDRMTDPTPDDLLARSDWPTRVYLQTQGLTMADRADLEVTWCVDQIEDHDIGYVRDDLFQAAEAERDAAIARAETAEVALDKAAQLAKEMEDEWWRQPPGVTFTGSSFRKLVDAIRALKGGAE